MNKLLVAKGSAALLLLLMTSAGMAKSFTFKFPNDPTIPGECCDFKAKFVGLSSDGMKFDKVKLPVEGDPDEYIPKHHFVLAAHPHRNEAPKEYRLYTSIHSDVQGSLKLKYTVTCKPTTMKCPKDKAGKVVTKVTVEDSIDIQCGSTPHRVLTVGFDMDEAKTLHNIVYVNADKSVVGKLDARVNNPRLCPNL